jgi:hypothetical protein
MASGLPVAAISEKNNPLRAVTGHAVRPVFQVGFDKRWRHQPDRVSERAEHARPEMLATGP